MMPRTERNRRRDQTMILRDLRVPRRDRRPDDDFFSFPLDERPERPYHENMTNTNTPDWFLDSVLDALIPGIDMTLESVCMSLAKCRGHDGDSPAQVLAALERLNYLNAEGREVRITVTPGGKPLYNRPILVGMGATICLLTDRHAATVIGVSSTGYKVTVQRDKATRTDKNEMSDSQTYSYERDPNGAVEVLFRHADGRYGNRTGRTLVLGSRRKYHDYSF